VLVVAGLIALIYFRMGSRPATYTLSQPWTHGPVLWSATDEAIPDPGHEHGHGTSHGQTVLSVGGGASGGW
jgi:hypothetical protein